MKKLLVAFIAFGFLCFVPHSHATWQYYRAFNATTSATAIPASQSNFPALIDVKLNSLKTTSTDATNGRIQNANGYDIAPFSDNQCTSQLPFERENYASSTGELEMWVGQSTLNTSTVDYLCYGNPNQTTDLSSSTAPWDSNYVGVWHFPNGTTLNASDSTANGNGGVASGTNLGPPTAAAGIIDGAVKINGTTGGNSRIKINEVSSTLAVGGAASATWEFWINATSTGMSQAENNAILSRGNSANGEYWYYISWMPLDYGFSDAQAIYFFIDKAFTIVRASSSVKVAPDTWSNVSISYNPAASGTLSFYINGAFDRSFAIASSSFSKTTNLDGTFWGFINTGHSLNGKLDEGRISNTSRSASWITTDYWNSFATGTAGFWSVGNETAVGGGGGATNAIQNAMAGGILQCSNSTLQVANTPLQVQ